MDCIRDDFTREADQRGVAFSSAATTNVEPVAAAGRVGGGSGKYVPPAQREGRRAGETMGTRMRGKEEGLR